MYCHEVKMEMIVHASPISAGLISSSFATQPPDCFVTVAPSPTHPSLADKACSERIMVHTRPAFEHGDVVHCLLMYMYHSMTTFRAQREIWQCDGNQRRRAELFVGISTAQANLTLSPLVCGTTHARCRYTNRLEWCTEAWNLQVPHVCWTCFK